MQPDLLQQLADLHLPVVPGWWPPAPGWWLLAGFAVALLVVLVRSSLERRRRQRPYRAARARLAVLGESFTAGRIDSQTLADATNALLKRSLIVRSGRQPVARLHGEQWLDHLDSILGGSEFRAGPGAVLGSSRFDPVSQPDTSGVLQTADRLLRQLERTA